MRLLIPSSSHQELTSFAKNCLQKKIIIDKIQPVSLKDMSHDLSPLSCHCYDATFKTSLDTKNLNETIRILSAQLKVDIFVMKENIQPFTYKAAFFDMDSTLIENEVINELAKENGVLDKVSQITEEAMNGRIDFDESFRQRLALLKGLNVCAFERIQERVTLSKGAATLIQYLKKRNYMTVLISGGFTYFANNVKERLKLDAAYANTLDVESNQVTGLIKDTIVGPNEKAVLLKKITQANHIALEETIAVGDGANDIPMLSLAGISIAYHAKPKLIEKATYSLSHTGLDGILFLI
jgi:phosphoserine phosphatase